MDSDAILSAVDWQMHRVNTSTQNLYFRTHHVERTGKGERIAVVDDNPDLRWFGASVLQREGFDAVALDGNDTELMSDPKTWHGWDAVVMDYMMPITGDKLAEIIERESPATRVLLVTAWPFTRSDTPECLKRFLLLPKPFTVEDLISSIHLLIDDS